LLRGDKLPASICDLDNLQELRLSYNKIDTIPENFGRLVNLQRFYFQNNWLSSIPESVANLANRTQLNLNRVQLDIIPEILVHLPKLQYLWIQPDWWQSRSDDNLEQLQKKGCKIYL
jgi:Leucine-rich repeat (LRR) protein